MTILAQNSGLGGQLMTSLLIFGGCLAVIFVGQKPLRQLLRRQEAMYDQVLRGKLLIDISPRVATVLTGVGMLVLAICGMVLLGGLLGFLVGAALGAAAPYAILRTLKRRRLERLESQLVAGIQTLASGVRAGLNLVQSMQLVSRDGPVPLRQEFAHLLREYEYGVSLEDAMDNAADRIGSEDFRLLFAALQTHRERGGDLAQTLDRISESIREIQRLENRVKTLTAQGRATARWLGAMPAVVLAILYFLVDPAGVRTLFVADLGKIIIFVIVLLNIFGFIWIRKIVSVDV